MSEQLKSALTENMKLLMSFKQGCIWRIKKFNFASDKQDLPIIEMMIENQIKFTKN